MYFEKLALPDIRTHVDRNLLLVLESFLNSTHERSEDESPEEKVKAKVLP